MNSSYMKNYMSIYNQQKVECECGVVVCKGAIYKHKQSSKHIKNLFKQGRLIQKV